MAIERTLSIVKPDGVQKNLIGEVYRRFEQAGLRIVAARMMQLSQAQAEGFYAVHRERPFYRDLVRYMTSGPVIVQVLEGENAIERHREIMGATDPKKAAKGTIRADLAAASRRTWCTAPTVRIPPGTRSHFISARATSAPESAEQRMSEPVVNLLGLPRRELEAFFVSVGEKPFRARQLMKWLYGHGVLDPAQMTDLGVALRQELAARGLMRLPAITAVQESADGTVKWSLDAGAGQAIETVFIPEPGRGTLCVSSQVGCAMDCSFCATGHQGFNRNLSAADIIAQVALARRELGDPDGRSPVTNVVFMGMGEPLANFRALVQACEILVDDLAYKLSRRRVTVSTSGLVPQIRRLAQEARVALAVSLHAPDDDLRNELVPINRRHPIAELLDACWDYVDATNTKEITIEYVMLKGVNDSPAHARRLVGLLRNRPAKVNLIPFNPFPETVYQRSSPETVQEFRLILSAAGIVTVTRRTRGDDIAAACGQLAGQVENRVRVPLGSRLQEHTWLS